MTKTTNYQLNQWAKSDRVLMDDFNADNAKIDAALKANADATPKLAFGSYKGTGTYGSKNKTAITFPFAPKWLMIYTKSGSNYALWNELLTSSMTTHINYDGRTATLSLNGYTLSWYADNAPSQLNTEDETYYYIVVG